MDEPKHSQISVQCRKLYCISYTNNLANAIVRLKPQKHYFEWIERYNSWRSLCLSGSRSLWLSVVHGVKQCAMLNKMHIYKSILCPVVLYSYTATSAVNDIVCTFSGALETLFSLPHTHTRQYRNKQLQLQLLFTASHLWKIFKIDERT